MSAKLLENCFLVLVGGRSNQTGVQHCRAAQCWGIARSETRTSRKGDGLQNAAFSELTRPMKINDSGKPVAMKSNCNERVSTSKAEGGGASRGKGKRKKDE